MSLKPVQKRELVITLEANSLERMRKQATVTIEQPKGSTFSIICDEGPYLDGDDSAPAPLAYYSAGIAFCLLTQLSRYAKIMKLGVEEMTLRQETRFAMEGSALQGTLTGRGLIVETTVDITSDEPKEKIIQMVRVGKQSCLKDAIQLLLRIRHPLNFARPGGNPQQHHPTRYIRHTYQNRGQARGRRMCREPVQSRSHALVSGVVARLSVS